MKKVVEVVLVEVLLLVAGFSSEVVDTVLDYVDVVLVQGRVNLRSVWVRFRVQWS